MWHIAGVEVIDDLHPLVVLMLLWTSLAFIVILLRMYTRVVIVRQLGADDWLMALAMVISIATDVGTGYQLKYGMGTILEMETVVAYLHSLFATLSIYIVAQTLYKLSVAVQCYRLFSTTTGRRVILGLIAWITICGIMTFCGSTFYCFPMRKAWDERVVGGWCVDSTNLYYVGAALNILNDIFLIAIPIPFLVKLHVAPKQKVILLSIFACGVTVTVVSIIRIKAMFALRRTDTDSSQAKNLANLLLWTHLELNLAIICGSIPALKAFVDRVILGRKDSTMVSTYDSHQESGSHSRRLGARRSGQDVEGGVSVKTDIELRTHPLAGTDDTGSEKGLIVPEHTEYRPGSNWKDADILPVNNTYQRNPGLR